MFASKTVSVRTSYASFKMRLLPIALLVAALSCTAKDRVIAPAEPKRTSPAELQGTVESLPKYAHFSISGVAFLDGRLFATTNVGLLELDGSAGLTAFYRWYDDFNTVSGPWRDAANNAIWIFREDDGRFVRLDARRRWSRFDLPAPPRGYYSRGDALEGFSIVATAGEPRMFGSGFVWQLQGSGSWSLLPTPKAPEFSSIKGYSLLPDQELVLVRAGICLLPPCNIEAHRLQGGTWQEPLPIPLDEIKQVVQIGQLTYVRGAKGRLVSISGDSVVSVVTPGDCEAIATTSSGRLLASFRNLVCSRMTECRGSRSSTLPMLNLKAITGSISLNKTDMSLSQPRPCLTSGQDRPTTGSTLGPRRFGIRAETSSNPSSCCADEA